MLSVGIDIGTTTTQLVFSDLTLASAARAGQVPRLAITGRSVRYASPILATPLLDAETLDAPGLGALLRAEYRRAGISPAQVETGAVIITGGTMIVATSITGAGTYTVTGTGELNLTVSNALSAAAQYPEGDVSHRGRCDGRSNGDQRGLGRTSR